MNDLPGSRLSRLDIILLITYALVCLGIGIYASRRQKDSDFMIAGRKIGMLGFVTSIVASYVGGAALVAYSAYVYRFGISALAIFVGTSLGFLLFIPYAMKLRKISGDREFYTLSDWFFFKFGKKTGVTSAMILLVVYFGMLLNQFIAGSSLLSSISGWSYETSLLLSSSIIAAYLLAGGFRSVIRTDVFQYFVLLVVLIIVAAVLFGDRQGLSREMFDVSRMDVTMTIAFIAFGVFIIFQSAEYWQRVYAAKSDTVVRNGLVWAVVLSLLTGLVITLVGLAAHHNLPDLAPREAFASGLTLLIPGTFIGAALVMIFAAIMSSADTQIFVLASSVSVDYFDKLSAKKPGQKKLMKLTQLAILGFALLGFACAYFLRDLVAVVVFITGVGFTIIPAAIASFHFRITDKAAISSFIAGVVYVVSLVVVAAFQDDPFEFFKNKADLAILSILISTLALLIVQFITKPKPKSA